MNIQVANNAIQSFNIKELQWELKMNRDKNHSDADVIVYRSPLSSFNVRMGLGEIIITSDKSFDECIKEYKSYWEYLIHGVHNRVEMGLPDYYEYEYKNVKYYIMVD